MNILCWAGITVVIFVLSAPVSVPAGEALSIEQAVEVALARNPDLLAVRQELEVARGGKVNAFLFNQFNPMINGQAWNRDNPRGGNVMDQQVLLAQEVEVAGQRGLRREEAIRNVARVAALVQDRERLMIGEVKRTFFQALMLKKTFELRTQIQTLNRRIGDASKARFQAGVISVMEYNLAEIRYGLAQKETFSAEAAFQNSLVDLRRLLGWEPDRPVTVAGDLKNSRQSFLLADLLQQAKAERPDLLATKRAISRMEAAINLTRRLIVPNPTFQGLYQTETEGPEGVTTMVGGGISFPLPVFNRNQGDLVTQGGALNQIRHQMVAVTRNIEREVKTAFQSYEAARRSVEVFETKVLDRIQENFRLIEMAYQEGKIGLLQLIVVQDELLNAQLSYVGSLGQLQIAVVNLQQAVGRRL